MLCHASDVFGVMDKAEDVGSAVERDRGREQEVRVRGPEHVPTNSPPFLCGRRSYIWSY